MRIIKIVLTLVFIGLLLYVAYLALLTAPPNWTGFGVSVKDPKIEPAKTLFDWLKLIIIPFSLGLIGWSYKEAEKSKAKKTEEERARNETLDSFFKIITKLLRDFNLNADPTPHTRAIAKTRLNMSLFQLDGARKGKVLQFLYESDLIDKNPKYKLLGANFNDAILDNIVLGEAEIRGAFFKNASIKNANLNGIILNSSNLENADLSGSQVRDADFSYMNLRKCKLKNMDLTSVNFEGADLTLANLKGSTIKKEQLDSIYIKKNIRTTKNKII